MSRTTQFTTFFYFIVLTGLGSLPATYYFAPQDITSQWIVAFLTLLALAVLSALLALRITEGGTTTSMEFLPQLGAIPLLGPFGAALLTFLTIALADVIILRKNATKALFNTSQMCLSVALAGVMYITFGARPGLDNLPFIQSFPPFLVGVIAFFAVNSFSVSYIISLTEGKPFWEIWNQAAGRLIVFDVAISPLAYLVAFLYVQWGPVALLAAILPILGLRYSYGVNIELQQLNQDLLRVLVKTLEARDQYTSGHSIRVAERARRIAQELKLRPRRIRLIETAALLHDIGKIDLAYGEILRQTGPLSPLQRELIRAHPDKGVEILKAVRSLNPEILDAVRHHHEWFDGTGYPLGISGTDIPLGARIIMLADAIDAMLTDRPYRSALSPDDVQRELIRNAGTQFDPDIADIALRLDIFEKLQLPPSEFIPEPPDTTHFGKNAALTS